MRVLYDHQIFNMQKFGGISRYFNELMKSKSDGLHIVKIDPELFDPIPEPKYDLFSRGINYTKRKVGIKEKQRKLPGEALKIFLEGNYDVFHPTYYDPYFLTLTKKPFVLTVYDMIHEIYKESFSLTDPVSYYKRLLCDKASHIITISENTRKDLIDIFKLPVEKVHAIQLASGFDKLTTQRPKMDEAPENYILYTGVRFAYKNFYFSVVALAELLKSDKDLMLVCTGPSFSAEERTFFKELGIERQVKHIYLQNDNELAWAYKNARLFIFPSLYEGFGFPLLEAFACGCPVIASNGGSLPEVGGEAVLYFQPKKIREIQDAAHKALYDDVIRENLVAKGKHQFKKFSWEKCRRQTLEVYHKIADD